ncbi:RIO1 family regulatory kinase/ATPase [Acinetobacter sp. MD2]|uniref:RIO1 family regulatory kinase/ATPase domain-containing protein n=1 Tax=Acinetobacter sp. MD2 TaxID=2600066 RepID=UPI002D1F4698|nr:RIO1 family regulatory kinase/ATPase [Acinetobacter sp. MD2]MEB3767577.1 hypothetical protein [Acinetobacter sp. MD2]
MEKYQLFLAKTASQQIDSIQSYNIDGIKVWLKKASKRHPKWLYMLATWATRLFNVQLLTPVPNYGGAASIQCEAARIESLAAIGVHVPKVLAVSDQGLLIQDIASDDHQLMQLDQTLAIAEDFNRRFTLFKKAAEEIKKIHLHNGYLSEAFGRNILVDRDLNISFIDFETDPITVLDLATCQARDWLCFLFSTAFRFQEHERPQVEQYINQLLHDQPTSLYQLSKLGRRFGWLNKVKVEKTGNDGKRMKIFLMLLQGLKV